jgi:tetratricopeptide (TPR) repeat protein
MIIIQLIRNTLCLVIFFALVAACSSKAKQTDAPSQQAAADSVAAFLRNTVNPLFVDQKIKESRIILDSLGPVVTQLDNYTLTCAYTRFMGLQYLLEKKQDSALACFRQALALATQKDTTLKEVIAAKTQIVDLFIDKKQLDSALLYARESYYLAKKIDTSRMPMILLKLTKIYSAIGDMPLLRKYLFEGFHASRNMPKYRFAFANNISQYYDAMRQVDSSLQFYQNFVQHDTSFSNPYFDVVKYENLGILLTKTGKLQEGLQYQLKAMQLNRELNQLDAGTVYNTAVTYSKLHKFDTAEIYLRQALELANKEKDLESVSTIWRRWSDNYRLQRRWHEAVVTLDSSYVNYERSVDSSFATKARELETQYAVKAKDDEIHDLAFSNEVNQKIRRQQQLIITTISGAFILVAVLGFVLSRRSKLAVRLRQASLEQRLLRSQMEPHFIFNTLSVLQSFIRNNEGEKAIRYLNQFARLLRVTLENSRESFVPLKEEVTALENYLSLQAMRFEGSFDYRVNVYEMYEDDDLLIPPMLLQPFVENAILHGMRQLNRKGHIEVTILREAHILHCVIEDNGSGIQIVAGNKQKRSLSTLITQERLAILSRQTRQPAGISIVDKKEEQAEGTRVVLQIPFRKMVPFNGSGENINGF